MSGVPGGEGARRGAGPSLRGPRHPSHLTPQGHVTEVHGPLQKPPVELVGHLRSQRQQVARGCAPGEAGSGDGQLPGAEGGRQPAPGRAAVPEPWCRGSDADLGALRGLTQWETALKLEQLARPWSVSCHDYSCSKSVTDATEGLPPASSWVFASSCGRPCQPGRRAGGSGGSG